MNLAKLKQAEKSFLKTYPGGFNNPVMIEMGKKHKMVKMVNFARENFQKKNFDDAEEIVTNTAKLVSQSSMVSVFEKPKFRDFSNTISPVDVDILSEGLKMKFYGNEQKGFEMILEVLKKGKMAKWTIISALAVYFKPDEPRTLANPGSQIRSATHPPSGSLPNRFFIHRFIMPIWPFLSRSGRIDRIGS